MRQPRREVSRTGVAIWSQSGVQRGSNSSLMLYWADGQMVVARLQAARLPATVGLPVASSIIRGAQHASVVPC